MKVNTVRQVIMISEKQAESLKTLKKHNINVSQFIRQAIKEKLKRDWKIIKESNKKEYCPF
ncbi:MAG: hypothetical protein KUL78_11170 [Flavobacterium sp.]|nr:hypothetical protein [Flavobacterium sp.]